MSTTPPPAPSAELSLAQALETASRHWNARQPDQAELLCRRILAVYPGQPETLHLMGLMAHDFGNLDLAIQYLREACQSPRAPAVFSSDLAEMFRQRGLLAEAEQFGRRAAALDAALVPAWNNLGIILQEVGKLDESLACLQRVVALQPTNAQAHNNLANTFKRLGRFDQAQRHYAEACTRNPDYAEAHSNLSNLLADRGLFDEAAAEARRAIALNPQLPDAYINLAAVETACYRYEDALRWLDTLLAFAPLHASGLAAKALNLNSLSRPEEALKAARLAVSASPRSAEAHNTLGQILQGLGRSEEAMEAFAEAERLPGLAAEAALSNRALLLMEAGRKEEALVAFARAREAFPESAKILYNFADVKTFSANDPDIALMERLLATRQAEALGDRMSLHFALGKAYLDCGDSARAFTHLNAGNRLKRDTLTYDPEATSRRLREIATIFDGNLFERFEAAGAVSNRPVFIVGMPRSGTTLVEQILASHPEIHGAGELAAMQRLAEGLGHPLGVSHLQREDLGRLGAAYLDVIGRLDSVKRHVIDKLPANFLYLGLIRLILPNAKVIHCRRDPVDTCLSCYTKLFAAEQMFAYDLTELGRFHRDYQDLMRHWRRSLPPDFMIEVDYEAVVADLPGEARRLVDFLGLGWNDACLRFHETSRVVRTASVNQVRQPLYRTSIGRWKKHEAQLAPLLAALDLR